MTANFSRLRAYDQRISVGRVLSNLSPRKCGLGEEAGGRKTVIVLVKMNRNCYSYFNKPCYLSKGYTTLNVS